MSRSFKLVCAITAGSLFAIGCGGSDVSTRGQSANNGGSSQVGTGGQSSGSGSGSGGSSASSTGSGGTQGPSGSGGGGSGTAGSAAGAGGGPVMKPPVIPAGKVFFDDFEDGEITKPSWIDADPTLGGMWSVVADAAGDSGAGNKVLAQKTAGVSDWIIAVSGDYRWTDQVVEAKAKYTSVPGVLGIFARFKDLDNYYFLYLDGSNITLRKVAMGSSTTLLKVKTPAVEGTWYNMKLSVVGTTLTGYLDDKMLVTAMDADVKSGGIGVGTDDSATAEFDDVTVSVP